MGYTQLTRDGLIEYLKTMPEDVVILHSSDEEGNKIDLACVDDGYACNQDGDWVEVAPEDIKEYEEDWDVVKTVLFYG